MSEENNITNEISPVQDLINQISKVKEDAAAKKQEILQSGLSTRHNVRKKTKDGRVFYNDSPMEAAQEELRRDTKNKIGDLIKNFPVAKTKDELYEFIQFLKVNNEYKYDDWYAPKYNECIKTVTRLFPDDALFKEILDEENEKQQAKEEKRQKEKNEKNKIKLLIIGGIIIIILAIIVDALSK